MVVLDRELITKALESKVGKVIHYQLEQVRVELDRQFCENSLSKEVVNDLTKIQCIINDAFVIGEKKELDLINKIDLVLDKVKLINREIRDFQKKHEEPLPDKIFEDLDKIILSCVEKLVSARKQLEQMQNTLAIIVQAGKELEKDGNKDIFKNWAEAVEFLAEALEECLENFPDIPLGMVEDLATGLLSATSEKTYELTSKEKYRSRIKYAATFILELVRKKRYQYLSSKSAEAKAIERIKNTEETEWIVVSEPGKTINIDQINERLKKRGYNVQISHKNSSAG
ncbi:hypothetical protein [Iningainema tapete]|uniref:Uncharacterized protein n=1 Tax=Iningainema tapete BLCC-T55 TaxID=2748662 RepID=A0A8J6XJT6_9CYAN|nr:hypothetical protein [Iningainema tapete]MBD2773846.1 hypothetical protein [Iningainema tapete BLCC-T55]